MPGRRAHPRAGENRRTQPRRRQPPVTVWSLAALRARRVLRRRPSVHRRCTHPRCGMGLRRCRSSEWARGGLVAGVDPLRPGPRRSDRAAKRQRSTPAGLTCPQARSAPRRHHRRAVTAVDGSTSDRNRGGGTARGRRQAGGRCLAAAGRAPRVVDGTSVQQGQVRLSGIPTDAASGRRRRPISSGETLGGPAEERRYDELTGKFPAGRIPDRRGLPGFACGNRG